MICRRDERICLTDCVCVSKKKSNFPYSPSNIGWADFARILHNNSTPRHNHILSGVWISLAILYLRGVEFSVLQTEQVTSAWPRRDNRQQIDDGWSGCRTAYFRLPQLRLISRSLSPDAAKAVVQAFITCRLDYCNSLLLASQSQAVQYAVARQVSEARRSDSITPVLLQLHWLPFNQRVEYKLAVLTHKAVHGLLPAYLAGNCQLVSTTGRC